MMRMKLNEICEVYSGYALKSFNDAEDGLPVVKIGNILTDGTLNLDECQYTTDSVNEKYYSNKGDIYIALSGATTGKIGIMDADERYVVNQRVGIVRKKSDDVPQEYIKYFLLRQTDRILQEAAGCAQPNISPKQIAEYSVPEITKEKMFEVCGVLDKTKRIIDMRKAELTALDDLIKARFVEMFGTPYVNEKGFPMLTVDDVIEFTGGAQPDKKYFEYEPTEDNIRLIQIRDYKTDNYITYIPKSMAKRFCEADDIMIGRYGPPIFQILKGIEGSYNVALMKATPKIGNKEFIRYFLKQECLFNYLDGLSQRTAGQSGIEMPALKAYPFPYPPIELQEQFEQFANQVDKSKVG